MELKVAIITNKETGVVSVNDFDTLVEQLKTHLGKYDYVDFKVENSNVVEVKDERAFLNKYIKLIDDVRIAKDKEIDSKLTYQPQLKTLIKMMKEKEQVISKGLNEYETQQDAIKRKQIEDIWYMVEKPFEISIDKVWNDKWLNKSYSPNLISEEMIDFVVKVDEQLDIIKTLSYDDKRKSMITKLYQESLNLNDAIAQEAKWYSIYEQGNVFTEEEVEANKKHMEEQSTIDDKIYQVSFKVIGTKEQLGQLSNYLKSNNLKYEQLKGGK